MWLTNFTKLLTRHINFFTKYLLYSYNRGHTLLSSSVKVFSAAEKFNDFFSMNEIRMQRLLWFVITKGSPEEHEDRDRPHVALQYVSQSTSTRVQNQRRKARRSRWKRRQRRRKEISLLSQLQDDSFLSSLHFNKMLSLGSFNTEQSGPLTDSDALKTLHFKLCSLSHWPQNTPSEMRGTIWMVQCRAQHSPAYKVPAGFTV